MTSNLRLLIAAPALAAGLLIAPIAAHADYYRGGYYGHGYGRGYGGPGYYHRGPGGAIAGAIVGLGAGALIAGALAPRYYAPPPVVYAPPPVYYAPPPVYYAPRPYYPGY